MGVGARTQALLQQCVKLMFERLGRLALRDRQSQALQPGCGHEDQQGVFCDAVLRKII